MPRTAQVLLIGFSLLAFFALVGHIKGGRSGMAKAMTWFVPVWLALTVYNMWEGVRVGHGVVEELPFLLINFVPPSLLAWMLRNKRA